MAREIILGGYSDDTHILQRDGGHPEQSPREYVVHIQGPDGFVVRATMEFTGSEWVCRLTAPDSAVVWLSGGDIEGSVRG